MFVSLYKEITSTRNLFQAWKEFRKGKGNKKDVLQFEYHLEQNIFGLHRDLESYEYKHGPYQSFYITDPKRRHIHKATVRDRVIHHAIYKTLYPVFNKTFIATSFSCRIGFLEKHRQQRKVLWILSFSKYTDPASSKSKGNNGFCQKLRAVNITNFLIQKNNQRDTISSVLY